MQKNATLVLKLKMTNEQTAIRTTYFSISGNTASALIKGLAGFFLLIPIP